MPPSLVVKPIGSSPETVRLDCISGMVMTLTSGPFLSTSERPLQRSAVVTERGDEFASPQISTLGVVLPSDAPIPERFEFGAWAGSEPLESLARALNTTAVGG